MLKEILPSFKKSFEERLSNPILGTFSIAWIIINWRLWTILLFSKKTIEDKITFIEKSYVDWHSLFLYPLIFTVVYLVIFPWLLLGIQLLQEKANGQRKIHKLGVDAKYAKLRVELVEAEAEIESLKLRYTLDAEMKKKSNEMELEQDKVKYEFEIEKEKRHMEFDFEERKAEYEERRKRKDDERNYESKMRELEYEEKRRRDSLELERLKIENDKLKK
jgi:signal transduction histidine kinase